MSNRESAWCSGRFFHTRTVARARARISKDGIRRWPCSLFAVSTCRRTAWTWWCCLRGGSFGRDGCRQWCSRSAVLRRQLCDEHVAAENQAAHLEDAMLRRFRKRRQMRLEADIRFLVKRLAEMVAANGALAQRYELLTSMPGVGPVLAFTLIALLPELGKMSRKQIAAL